MTKAPTGAFFIPKNQPAGRKTAAAADATRDIKA